LNLLICVKVAYNIPVKGRRPPGAHVAIYACEDVEPRLAKLGVPSLVGSS
jgi:hypothetical protein